jgi:hypothetical protein
VASSTPVPTRPSLPPSTLSPTRPPITEVPVPTIARNTSAPAVPAATTASPRPTVGAPQGTRVPTVFSPPPPADGGHGAAGGTIGVVAGGVGGFLLLMLVVVAGIRFALGRRRRSERKRGGRAVLPLASTAFPDVSPPSEPSRVGRSRTEFSFEELSRATDAFDDARLLGPGGFGKVYRGELRDEMTVAVKYSVVQGDAEVGEREFQSELEVISRVHHKHLVSFLGYATDDDKRLLVLQFMPNGTLYGRIHADASLDWAGRLKAAVGAARGLAYLHKDCRPAIIHRDIKSNNILMDANMDARVADFGISKLKEESYVNTHVSTRVIGTFGYLDPAYASTGRLTAESDTYSFGVILLELVTGRNPIDGTRGAGEESLVAWSRGFIEDEAYFGIIDPFLKETGYDRDEVRRVMKTAWLCTKPSRQDRPTMSQVLRYLEGNVRPGSPRRPERDALTMLADEMFMTGR